jgi:hypothetical protein
MACSNRLHLGFLGVLYKSVEFDFEGCGFGGGVSWFGAHDGGGGLEAAAAGRVGLTWALEAVA